MRMSDFSLGDGKRFEGGNGQNRNVACLSDSQSVTNSMLVRIEGSTDAQRSTLNYKVKSFKVSSATLSLSGKK